MSDDIKLRLEQELQEALQQMPNLAPVQFVDGQNLITMTICDGIPQTHVAPLPEIGEEGLSHLSELGASSQPEEKRIYQIYNLLRAVDFINQEDNAVAATQIMAQVPLPQSETIELTPPQPPSAEERIASTVTGRNTLAEGPDHQGLHQNLKAVKEKLAQLTQANPDLAPLILKTNKGTYQVSTRAGELQIHACEGEGSPYMTIRDSVHAQLYTLHKTVASMEQRLFGGGLVASKPKATQPSLSPKEKMVHALSEFQGGEVAIRIKSRKETLYLSQSRREVIYCGIRYTLNPEGAIQEETLHTPQVASTQYVSVEMASAPEAIREMVKAFQNYLSVRTLEKSSR